jgi:dTDP-4-dehydrorhamnose reductase
MRILVTGTQGQVVCSLVERAAQMPDVELITIGRPELDLAKPLSVRRAIAAAKPDLIVSAAAYTAVDRAEDEPELAYVVNAIGAASVAEAATRIGVPIIHLSTDYVFSGDRDRPYREDDDAVPKTIYGYTKLESEHAIASVTPHHIILRTSWVYSPFGANFVKTMLRLAGERDAVSVVSDQWGNPTSALDIADAILRIASRPIRENYGVYHLTGTGEINWSGFASHIFRTSRIAGGPFASVREILSADYPTKAKRPLNSRLSTDKFEETFGWRAPAWQDSVDMVVKRLIPAGRHDEFKPMRHGTGG